MFLENPTHARYLLDVWEFMGRIGRNEVSKMPIWKVLPSNCYILEDRLENH